MRLSSGTIATLAVGLALGVAGPASVPAASAAPAGPETVTLTGSGWGHGKGLSQWGARGAADQGLAAAQILDFYYPGTQPGLAGGSVKVLITADTSSNVVVQHRSRLKVRSLATGRAWKLGKRGAKRWKLTAHGADTKLSVKTRRWRKVRIIPGQAEFQGKGGTIRVYVPGGAVDYRGKIRSVVPANGQGRDTVNVVSVEKYLRGVVPSEMPATWHPQAVQAQVVAARTYAVFERDNNDRGVFDVWDTTQSQVYRGVAAEEPESNAAIAATAGQVRTYGGLPAFTQFSSSNGGWTAPGSFPYQVAKADPYEALTTNPNKTWQVVLTDDAIEAQFPGIGDFLTFDIVKDPQQGGRVTSVKINGAAGSTSLSGDAFRVRFGLRSTMFA
ncbi:SpoIID/LytB domain-containing protein [Nocardioides daeguensis]|uniref:Sporulation stage II protein D amidase enhancer LytB N-terminal domain-containing protein n=1 Tax=Nocardioides daeguensis TaxID=908359 RepID=A0ABP6WCA5_9ACTN|nr:SpoIID/LytB domain-containing protein [Nocardioides daeguensis]MBV6729617.1 SpoIID/LytB domain-containing protein [Nocardioides daeguensis]MCR1775049.1 SpoIID/LytB domain-containing protein [Nocardioides daeguensis]